MRHTCPSAICFLPRHVGSTLAYTNIGCLNMDHCLMIVVWVLFCFVFDCLMFCNGNSLYERDDRDNVGNYCHERRI
jgi:hypothetical protein